MNRPSLLRRSPDRPGILTRSRRGMLVLAAALLTAALVAVPVLPVAPAPAAQAAASYKAITGSGSTWSQNALDQWRTNVKANYGIVVNYNGLGSSAGRRDFIDRKVDFAVSEIPFQRQPEDGSPPEVPPAGYTYMPIVAGGTSFMYNLKIAGKRVTNLRLSGQTITKIFTGVITRWNDPQIQSDNPGLAMPDREIVPVVRADGSGTTAQFTMWMSKTQGDLWNAFCAKVNRPQPCGLTSQYPTGWGNVKPQAQSLGVAGYVSQNYGEGAINYVEYSYALKAGFPVAKVLNQSGYYIEPTAASVAVALTQAQINTDQGSADYLTQILDGVYGNGDPRTYPLSSYSYMIVPTQVGGTFDLDKGRTLGAFASYFLCEGQQQADQLGYSPLPMNLVLAGIDQVKRIPGAEATGIDINRCNNPTFQPGDDPANNQLARTAPQPADCDRAGPNQCTTGTAGAREETPVSGGGTGGSADTSTNDAGAGPANGGASGGAAGGGGGVMYDADGVPISGGAGGAVVTASPQSLDAAGWSTWQTLMVLAAVLIVGIAAAPAVLPALTGGRSRRTPPA